MTIQLSYQASYVLPRISKSRWFLNLIGSTPDCDWICPMLCSFWNQKLVNPITLSSVNVVVVEDLNLVPSDCDEGVLANIASDCWQNSEQWTENIL